jgi:hypothetical protein
MGIAKSGRRRNQPNVIWPTDDRGCVKKRICYPIRAGPARIGANMKRVFLSLIGAMCVVASIEAAADDLPATQPNSAPPPPAAKSKIAKPPATGGQGLGDIQFSNPYAPPVGAGQATGANFPAAQRATPVDPKSGMSLTYKWHANNEPVDPYWHVRSNEYGPDGPGSTFLGGLKLGF